MKLINRSHSLASKENKEGTKISMLSQIYSFWYVENEVSTPMASVMEKLLSVKTIQDTVRLICQYKLLQNSGAIMLNRDGKFLSVREWLVMYKTFFSGFVMDRADKVDPGGTISGSLDRSTWQPWLRHWDVNVPPPQGDISFLAFKLPQDLFLRENKPEKKIIIRGRWNQTKSRSCTISFRVFLE